MGAINSMSTFTSRGHPRNLRESEKGLGGGRDGDPGVTLTKGAATEASSSWRGPEKIAEGRISPKMSTSVTDTRIATYSGTRRSKKMGRASFAC
eukprot:3653980-Pyramimonas_sp.AAC.2